jgi:predicted HTH transcriptional regulator
VHSNPPILPEEWLAAPDFRAASEIGAVRRKERANLPPVAVREAIINAVVYADYAQRGVVDPFHSRRE